MASELAIFARYPVLRRLLLPAGGFLAFLLFLVFTFPYDVLARRIEIEAQRAGAELTLGSVGAGGVASVRARVAVALGVVFLMTVKPDPAGSLVVIAIALVLGIASAVPVLRQRALRPQST